MGAPPFQSALQTFVQVNMKPAPPLAVGNTPTFELLRHARRVEQVAAPVLRPPTPPPEPTPAPIQQAAAASKSGSPAHAKGAAGPSGSRASLSSPPNARKRKRTDADMGGEHMSSRTSESSFSHTQAQRLQKQTTTKAAQRPKSQIACANPASSRTWAQKLRSPSDASASHRSRLQALLH